MAFERSNACPSTETPQFSQNRRHLSGATCLISASSTHRRALGSNLGLKVDNQRRVEVRESEEKISRRYVNDFVACTERHADRIFAFAHLFYLFLEEPPLHHYPNVGRGQMLIRMQ